MKITRKFSYYLSLGLLAVLFIAGIIWLIAGRISLFQSSSYTSRFALDTALELYQENVLWLDEETNVKQTFTAVYPGLHQVSVFFVDNTQELSEQDISVVFLLKEHCDSPQSIRRVVATTADMENDSFYPFTFVPIDESAGETYCFVVESVQDLDEQSIGVWASAHDVYAAGQAFYQPPPSPEDAQTEIPDSIDVERLANLEYRVFLPVIQAVPEELPLEFDAGFQLHYNGRPIDAWSTFMDRLVSHKSYFWGNKVFYVVLVGVYFVGVFLLARIKPE